MSATVAAIARFLEESGRLETLLAAPGDDLDRIVLTGVDTDRLKEEQERGLTIDIGFAYVDFPEVGRVSIVDVPGHEKFVTNMLVGALGLGIALAVLFAAGRVERPHATDDGPVITPAIEL